MLKSENPANSTSARNRGSIGPKLRFEIFKRDEFTCQYCGRKPPEVVLNCDHVLAVAKGGDDDPSNLLTSCWDCNIGKGDRDVDQAAIPIPEAAEMRREKLEQLKAIQEVRKEEKAFYEKLIEESLITWSKNVGGYVSDSNWRYSVAVREAMEKFIRQMEPDEMLEAVKISFKKFPALMLPESWETKHARLKYFCGICLRKIEGVQPWQQRASWRRRYQ